MRLAEISEADVLREYNERRHDAPTPWSPSYQTACNAEMTRRGAVGDGPVFTDNELRYMGLARERGWTPAQFVDLAVRARAAAAPISWLASVAQVIGEAGL